LTRDHLALLVAIASGAATDEALLERFDDLHLLRQLLAEGYVEERRMPQIKEASAERVAVDPTSFYSLSGKGTRAIAAQ
jgi:hypothetical protein